MSYRHVADESTAKMDFSIWRCAHCRALCVTDTRTQPPAKCGRCRQ